MCLAVLLVHSDTGGSELAVLSALAAADAFFFNDINCAVFIYAHCLILLGAGFVAGMILAVLADIDLVLELVELAEFHLDAAVAGTCYTVMNERAEQFAAGAAYAMAVFIGILDDMVVFHKSPLTPLCYIINYSVFRRLTGVYHANNIKTRF